MSTQKKNILDTDRIGWLLFQMSLPAFVGTLVNVLYNVVDTIFVGRYVGPLGIAGLSIVVPVQMLAMGMGNITGMGGSSLISRLIGAGDVPRAERTLGNANALTIIMSLVIIIVGYSNMDNWLRMMGASDTILPYAHDYMTIILIGMFFQTFSTSQNTLVRSEGNSRKAMVGMIIGASLNIILDAIFMIALGMGVKGAALATVIAQLTSTCYYLYYFLSGQSYLKLHAKNLIIDWSIVKGIMAIGVSAFAMSVGSSMAGIVGNRVFSAYGGDLAISTWGILSRIMMFSVIPGTVIAQGLQPIIGFNYGARRYDMVLKSIKLAALVATFFHLISFLVIYFFPKSLMGIFTTDSELIQLAADASRLVFIAIVFMGYFYVSQTVFMATGKAVQSLFTSMSRQSIFLIPSLLILPHFWQLNGAWLTFPVSDGLACLLVTVLLIPQLRMFRRGLKAG